MKALLAGAAGFIGSHLADALLDSGYRVVGMDNFHLGTMDNIAHLKSNPHFTFYEQDVCDLPGLKAVFDKEAVDYVFHLAANSDIRAGVQDPFVDYRCTYLTTFHLLECMRLYGVKHLFFASTSAVYGEREGELVPEEAGALYPVSYYGAAKLGSEALISASAALQGMSALVFRFPNVVGPRLTHGAVYDFIGKLRDDPARLEILGDGRQTKPYMYVDDLVGGIMRFMDAPEGMSVYNIGVDTQTNVTHIADIVCEAMGLRDVHYDYTGGRGGWPGDVPEFAYDLSKIHGMGWRAKYSSDEAVRMTAEALCRQ